MSFDRKQAILEAASKSFTHFGYKATTMDQVAKMANVGKGTIYTFFKNKEELFDEITTSLLTEMGEEADKVMNLSDSFIENVHRVLYKMLEYRMNHSLTIKIFQESKEFGTPAAQEVVRKVEQMIVHYIKEKIEQAIENGEVERCDPEMTAFVMLKVYHALIFDWEEYHEPLEKEEIANLFETYLFKGLSRR
ncbi:TetR/AcrR family transcriptional regulator [Bacillus sp. FJAT-47783]|uniref:TetR/AcrR family transcriptional regulator n=1 Tax=Bacillus sp. FJAT-47783 TaxID=2922712 RepID=UPI001FAD4317|nr:TetR/AcrR family transcriptional regulator [Bacillus sp. FJAT-47783]